jgi:hypothetical protein
MTNKEKIENWAQSNSEILEFYFTSQIEDNLFLYDLLFIDDSEKRDGGYDISVNEDDTISYLEHIR